MKQLLLRVADETHARVTEQARRAGISVNAYVNRLLDLGINPDTVSRRDRLRLRLVEIGTVGRQTMPESSGLSLGARTVAERNALLAQVRAEWAAAGGLSAEELQSALGRDRDS